MYADVYEKLQPAVSSRRSGRKRFRVGKRPSTSPAKRELEVNTKAERGRRHFPNQPRRSRSRQNASPSPLPSRKSRKGSRRRVTSSSPHLSRKQRSIIKQIDEIQDSLRRLIPEPDISPIPLPSLRYISFPIQRSPSPYSSSPSVPPARSPTLAPPTAVPGLPRVPYWFSNLIDDTPRPSRSPSVDLRSHTQRSLSEDAADIFEDQDAGILLPYGSPELKNADTDDLEGLTMDGMYLIIVLQQTK